ncbi:30S ribosomal protein S8 [Candidatus Parcubacteria bacterium]|nr:30S ribosomal protein S8 [Candidatus Parcubacteria bacterium]
MNMTDPIADMLTRIRNAMAVNKPDAVLPLSKIKLKIAEILEKEKYIEKFEKKDDNILITLKYKNRQPAISYLKRVSKPGCRIYADFDNLPIVLDNLGIAIISTSSGLMTNKEAWRKKIGGEIICEIY